MISPGYMQAMHIPLCGGAISTKMMSPEGRESC